MEKSNNVDVKCVCVEGTVCAMWNVTLNLIERERMKQRSRERKNPPGRSKANKLRKYDCDDGPENLVDI